MRKKWIGERQRQEDGMEVRGCGGFAGQGGCVMWESCLRITRFVASQCEAAGARPKHFAASTDSRGGHTTRSLWIDGAVISTRRLQSRSGGSWQGGARWRRWERERQKEERNTSSSSSGHSFAPESQNPALMTDRRDFWPVLALSVHTRVRVCDVLVHHQRSPCRIVVVESRVECASSSTDNIIICWSDQSIFFRPYQASLYTLSQHRDP